MDLSDIRKNGAGSPERTRDLEELGRAIANNPPTFGPNETICPTQPYGFHIRIRCAGCHASFHTKNIGTRRDGRTVNPERSVFPDAADCSCVNRREYPLIHICAEDDAK